MVQIGSAVQQFYIGETDEEQSGAQAGAETGGDPQAYQPQNGEVDVHAPARPGFQPAKAEVGEVMGRIDVERADPSVSEIADDDGQTQQTEGRPERYK